MQSEQLYSVLESRYEAELSRDGDVWTAVVSLVTKTSRYELARFVDIDEAAARDAAYTFLMERPR